MKAITCTAALATIGLLALSACVHSDGDGGPPVDPDTAALNESRGDQSAQVLDVIGAAAMSQPQFGGVVRAAAVDLASTSEVSTSYDGTDLTITVERDDGSSLTLNTGSDASDPSDPFDSPIAGHSARDWGVLKIDTDGISVARATVTANDSDAADYLSVGYWMHLAGDFTELNFTGVEVGAFADGPELSLEAPASLPGMGTASYYGPAGGAYAVVHGTDSAGPAASAEVGEFSSTVELTADFAANTISGCVGCRYGVALIGVLYDTDEGTDVYFADSGYTLHLDSIGLNSSDGTFEGGRMRLDHPDISITSTRGAWGGQFSNIADGAGDPRLVAGTFGAEATSAGGGEGAFIGSFVGTKE